MDKEKRKPTRLQNFDYSSNGYYFITICTKDMECILSTIENVGDAVPYKFIGFIICFNAKEND